MENLEFQNNWRELDAQALIELQGELDTCLVKNVKKYFYYLLFILFSSASCLHKPIE